MLPMKNIWNIQMVLICLIMKISYTHGQQSCSGFFSPPGSQQRYKEFSDVYRSWDSAAKHCGEEGLVMARLPSDATAAVALSNHIANSCDRFWYAYWLDARRSESGGFVWSDGSPVYATPYSSSSDTTATQCLRLYTSGNGLLNLYSYPCSDPYGRTLCQEANPVVTPFITQRPTTQRPVIHTPSATFRPASCGQTLTIDERITNGKPSTSGQFPWMVYLSYFSRFHKELVSCGGTLIDKRWVLTAAHCFRYLHPNIDVVVKIGYTDKFQREQESYLYGVTLKDIITHDGFTNVSLDNDIAMVRLPEDVTPNRLVQPICLATDLQIPFGGKAVAAGWGLRKPDDDLPTLLQSVELDVLEDGSPRCANSQLFICTFTPGKDTCRGDSGGPLMIKQENTWFQIGIVSFGPLDCGTSNIPGTYTRVPKYLPFILGYIRF